MSKRKILFTTGIRSDFFIQEPIWQAVSHHPQLKCLVVVTGAHLSKRLGMTINDIRKKKYKIVGTIDNLVLSDRLSARVKGAARQLDKMINIFEKVKPDIVVAPYDREEAITVALAGAYMNIPVAHLGAGENTYVNVDALIRHSTTKLSHIIFTSTKENAERVIKMGEEKRRVFHVGSPAVDRFTRVPRLSRKAIGQYFKLNIDDQPLMVNLQHPVSHEVKKSQKNLKVTLSAIDQLNYPTVIIYPNSDPGRNVMVQTIQQYPFHNRQIRKAKNIPEYYFVNLMRHADVLIGNSSMGIVEAPALKLPVVNVGKRQTGREHAENVIFVSHNKKRILSAINKCLLDENFKRKVKNCHNPYGSGHSAQKIANILAKISINEKLLNKRMTY